MTQSQSTDDLVNCAESLKAHLIAECSCGAGQSCSYCTWHDTIERLQADLAARDKTIETLREDAERYRWLKSQPMTDGWALVSLEIMDINEDGPTGVFYSHDGADLDAAIDAARSEEQP